MCAGGPAATAAAQATRRSAPAPSAPSSSTPGSTATANHTPFRRYYTKDATSGWAVVFFVSLLFLGSFFVLNLALVARAGGTAALARTGQVAAGPTRRVGWGAIES